jgi:hypothetical protein
VSGVRDLDFSTVFGGLGDLFYVLPSLLWENAKWFTIFYGLFFLLSTSLLGGALCRMAAVDFAGQEKLRIREALDYAIRAWPASFLALLLPLVFILAAVLVLGVCGWIFFNIPVADVLAGVLYFLALLIGLAAVLLLILYVLGFDMLLPAVACENCDAADADQRVFALVLRRPLHLLGYLLVLTVAVVVGYLLASLIARAVLDLTSSALAWWTDNPAVETAGSGSDSIAREREFRVYSNWHYSWAAGAIDFWQLLVERLVGAYVFACYFAGSTIVYLLMRRASDGQDTSEVWQPGMVPGTMAAVPEPMAVTGASVAVVDAARITDEDEG